MVTSTITNAVSDDERNAEAKELISAWLADVNPSIPSSVVKRVSRLGRPVWVIWWVVAWSQRTCPATNQPTNQPTNQVLTRGRGRLSRRRLRAHLQRLKDISEWVPRRWDPMWVSDRV